MEFDFHDDQDEDDDGKILRELAAAQERRGRQATKTVYSTLL